PRTVRAAPNHVATDEIPASRSARRSWTAPKAWEAMPHTQHATRAATTGSVKAAPASARPKTAGLTKWVLEVIESSTGRSLKRSPGAEYAMTAKTLNVRTRVDITSPSRTSATTKGMFDSAAAHRV